MSSNNNNIIIDESVFHIEQTGNFGNSTSTSSISIDIDPSYNRKPFPEDENDEKIESLWNAKRQKNPNMRLFNAMKFRLHDSSSSSSSSSNVVDSDLGQSKRLKLCLGISDYKSHTGTNLRPSDDSSFHQQQQQNDEHIFAHVMGVAACVVTADNYAIFFRRSKNVAENASLYCAPGGHPEPYRVFRKFVEMMKQKNKTTNFSPILLDEKIDEKIPAVELRKLYKDTLMNDISTEDKQLLEKIAVEEMFFSITEEVHSEVGVPLEFVKVERVLGVARATSITMKGKPDLCFQVRIQNCTFEEVKQKYFATRSGEDAFEAEDGSLVGLKLELSEETGKTKAELVEYFKKNIKLVAPCQASLEMAIAAL